MKRARANDRRAPPRIKPDGRFSRSRLSAGHSLYLASAPRRAPNRNHYVALLDPEVKTVFAAHPAAALFRDLPGAGAALAPRLCVAFGTLRTLYPDPASLPKPTSVALVREKSGHP